MSVRGLICDLFEVRVRLTLMEGASSSCSSTWLGGAVEAKVRKWSKKVNTAGRRAILSMSKDGKWNFGKFDGWGEVWTSQISC